MSDQQLAEELHNQLSKNSSKKTTITFYRQYFGWCSCLYAINK